VEYYDSQNTEQWAKIVTNSREKNEMLDRPWPLRFTTEYHYATGWTGVATGSHLRYTRGTPVCGDCCWVCADFAIGSCVIIACSASPFRGIYHARESERASERASETVAYTVSRERRILHVGSRSVSHLLRLALRGILDFRTFSKLSRKVCTE